MSDYIETPRENLIRRIARPAKQRQPEQEQYWNNVATDIQLSALAKEEGRDKEELRAEIEAEAQVLMEQEQRDAEKSRSKPS